MHVLLQYQSKSYYIIGQEVYYSIGRFYYIIGQLLQYRAFLLHYRAVITVSGVYYIIGWYSFLPVSGSPLSLCFLNMASLSFVQHGMYDFRTPRGIYFLALVTTSLQECW